MWPNEETGGGGGGGCGRVVVSLVKTVHLKMYGKTVKIIIIIYI
jgi:hypothetical protein